MRTLSTSVTSEAPARAAPRPRALLGARVTRAGADRSIDRSTSWVLIEAQLSPSLERALWTVQVEHDGPRIACDEGVERFERALRQAAALPADRGSLERSVIERAIARAQTAATERWRAVIADAIERGFATLAQTLAYAQGVIDERPAAQRAAAAKRARALLEQTEAQLRPELRIAARAAVTVRERVRVARWRLSSEAGWCWVETARGAIEGASHARCARCDEPSPSHALCARCLEDRCVRCARRCARCRRAACAACAADHRCPHCGLSAIEAVDDR